MLLIVDEETSDVDEVEEVELDLKVRVVMTRRKMLMMRETRDLDEAEEGSEEDSDQDM